ncbi:MAG: class I SAM-dependent methyltransferase [Chitinophagaceae bacterium]|nr:class I SAM-dependent methyltransferase [Chitinophagaceae bacterium]
MNIRDAYDIWSSQYDTNKNPTRDLEAKALQQTLNSLKFDHCLEIGCGTGKNTAWLQNRASRITAVDFSAAMLARAKEKTDPEKVNFVQADINEDWHFADEKYDLVSFSLVLEHIENLEPIFQKASAALIPGGYVYMGELHPFKQYTGTKARFENEAGRQVPTCFNHHISDFVLPAIRNGLNLVTLSEYFDDDDRNSIPRILAILFRKI